MTLYYAHASEREKERERQRANLLMFINFPERDESENSLTPANLRATWELLSQRVPSKTGDDSAPSGSTMLSATEVQFDVSSIRHNPRNSPRAFRESVCQYLKPEKNI